MIDVSEARKLSTKLLPLLQKWYFVRKSCRVQSNERTINQSKDCHCHRALLKVYGCFERKEKSTDNAIIQTHTKSRIDFCWKKKRKKDKFSPVTYLTCQSTARTRTDCERRGKYHNNNNDHGLLYHQHYQQQKQHLQ